MGNEHYDRTEPTVFNSLLTCIFLTILLFIALLFRHSNLVLLTILVLLMVGGAKMWSSLSLSRIRWSISVDKQRAFPGETLKLQTTLENAKFLPVWLRILWPIGGALQSVGSEEKIFQQEVGLLWYQRVQLHRDLVALRRGVHQVGPPRILSSDLLGFFEKEKRSAEPIRIIVFPKLIALKPVTLPKRNLFGVPGAKSPVKDPVYILGTRDYQPSRPSRYIHWKASARHLRLQEKLFEPSQQEKVLLVLEVGSFEHSKGKEAFEDTLEVIASMAVQLDKMGYAVGLIANGVLKDGGLPVVPMARSSRQIPALLEVLARLQMNQNEKLEKIMPNIMEPLHQVSCVFFSYDAGKAVSETKQYCQNHNIQATFFVSHIDPESHLFHNKKGTVFHHINEIHFPSRKPA